VCDELVAVVDKAKEVGYAAVEDDWKAVSDKLDAISAEAQTWATKYSNGELSAAEKAYYNRVLLPAASKSLDAATDMLNLIQ